MLTKRKKNKYIIKTEDEHIPFEVNATKLDRSLKRIRTALNTINTELENTYKAEWDIYKILEREIFEKVGMSISDGKIWTLSYAEVVTATVQERLTDDDVIPDKDECITLQDVGYKMDYINKWLWSRVLEDTDEKEVTEEIILFEKPRHRIRTIIWEKKDYGKSSKEIVYQEKPIGKKLTKIIENTKREFDIHEKGEEK